MSSLWGTVTLTTEIDSSTLQNVPPSDQLASYLHCCTTDIGLQVVYSAQRGVTHQQNLNGSFSPVNMGREGPGGRVCAGVQSRHCWNKDDGGTIGVQVHAESWGGDLGNGGGHRDNPAICPGQ